MSGRPLVAVWAAALAALVWSAPAGATVLVEVPLEDMVRDADAIVHAVVERTGSQMIVRDDTFEPNTVSVLRVRSWLKGEGGATVSLREIGGVWQAPECRGLAAGEGSAFGRGDARSASGTPQSCSGGLRIDGTPRYAPGEEVIVFLERRPEDGSYRTYGMVQGKFVVMHGVPGVPSSVQRDLDGVSFARWTDGQMTIQAAHRDPAMLLEGFLDTIRRWAR